jgi:hypothetical protein
MKIKGVWIFFGGMLEKLFWKQIDTLYEGLFLGFIASYDIDFFKIRFNFVKLFNPSTWKR